VSQVFFSKSIQVMSSFYYSIWSLHFEKSFICLAY